MHETESRQSGVTFVRRLALIMLLAGCYTTPRSFNPARAESPSSSLTGQQAAPLDVTLPQLDIVASRVDILGRATTASHGEVTREELDLRPIYRTGQLLESVPGLVVTVHSGGPPIGFRSRMLAFESAIRPIGRRGFVPSSACGRNTRRAWTMI